MLSGQRTVHIANSIMVNIRDCPYYKLYSFVPPSPNVDVANKQSLMSLGHLSAVANAKDTRNHQILAQTPAHLHKVISD